MLLLKLGSTVADRATELAGMITHVQIDSSMSPYYNFQPKGLNQETGSPIKGAWITEDRIKGAIFIEIDIPLDVLGTIATDKASGFKGTVTAITMHISGCLHAVLQPKGNKKDGSAIDAEDFDIRRLKGTKIPKLTEKQVEKQQKKKPSPANVSSITPIRV